MCKFHKDVARDIALNDNDEFDAGKYATALVAMASFRIEQYMPAMHGCDGFVPEVMLTDTAKEAFTASGLTRPQAEINAFRDRHIDGLRAAMNLTAQSVDLSLEALNIKDRIVRGGFKATCCAEPDPTKNGPFLDEAVVELFTGYDDEGKTWARGALWLLDEAHKPEFEAIRMAADHFISQDGVRDTLQGMFEHSLASVFQNAEASLAAGLSHHSDGCVMCGHGSRALKL